MILPDIGICTLFFLIVLLLLSDDYSVWNNHNRINLDVVNAHILDLCSLSPPVTITSPLITNEKAIVDESNPPDLDSSDESVIRSLLLGVLHRTAGEFAASRAFLEDVQGRYRTVKISTWVGGVATFETAVLELREAEKALGSGGDAALDPMKQNEWLKVLKQATELLDKALSLAPQSVDLSSRLDTRISMLRDEIATKREMLGA